jgi:hypothetical protein
MPDFKLGCFSRWAGVEFLDLIETLLNRLLTGSHISMTGGENWRRKLLILRNLGLPQHGCRRLLTPSHPKVRGIKLLYLRLIMILFICLRKGWSSFLIVLFVLTGYLPQNLYNLNSSYGSEQLLKALLEKMKQYNVRAMADIVINHRVGTTQGHGGMYNRYDGVPLSWDERAVTSCTGGLVSLVSCTRTVCVCVCGVWGKFMQVILYE